MATPIVYHNKHCLLFYVSFPSTIIYLPFCYFSFCWRLSWKSKQTKLPDWAPVRDCGSLRLSSKEISISNMSVKDESKIYSQNPSNGIYNGHKRWCEVFLMAVLSIPAYLYEIKNKIKYRHNYVGQHHWGKFKDAFVLATSLTEQSANGE